MRCNELMKKYIVTTTDGTCQDIGGREWENAQVIGIFPAPYPGAAIDAAWWYISEELEADYDLDSLRAYELAPSKEL